MGFIFLFGVGSGLHMENVFCFVINENQTLGSWPSQVFIYKRAYVCVLFMTHSYFLHCNLGLFMQALR